MAKTHRELEAWKIANKLRRRIYALTRRSAVASDAGFCDQIVRAINSACSNTSEGFYKFKHKPFAHSLRIARGELGEVRDELEAALQAQHLAPSEYEELEALASQALATNAGLLKYLEDHPDDPK
jgi:four helix bundle protein